MIPYSQQYHQWLGKHSGIPECCIDYFCNHIGNGYPFPWSYSQDHVGYVRCNECIRNGNIIEVHMCTEKCTIDHPILKETLFQNES